MTLVWLLGFWPVFSPDFAQFAFILQFSNFSFEFLFATLNFDFVVRADPCFGVQLYL